jgi:hypothetical protein
MIAFDFSEFEVMARRMNGAADQMAYAISKSLNEAIVVAKTELVDQTWPRHVTVRNPRFLDWALRIGYSNKKNLTASLYDAKGRGHLKKHAIGGTKRGKGQLAVPTKAVSRGARGVAKRQRPDALARKVVIGNRVFQRNGKGKNSRLRLMFVLTPQARIKADVPFMSDFHRIMSREVRRSFPAAMKAAMLGSRV